MSFTPLSYKPEQPSDFFKTLKNRIDSYFVDNKKDRQGDFRMYFKTFFSGGLSKLDEISDDTRKKVADMLKNNNLAYLYSYLKKVDPESSNKIHFNDENLERVAGKTGGALGSGGMYSKVMAAKQAAESKTISNIAWGREKDVLTRIYQGEYIGTLIHC